MRPVKVLHIRGSRMEQTYLSFCGRSTTRLSKGAKINFIYYRFKYQENGASAEKLSAGSKLPGKKHLSGFCSQLPQGGADGDPVEINAAAQAEAPLPGIPPQRIAAGSH